MTMSEARALETDSLDAASYRRHTVLAMQEIDRTTRGSATLIVEASAFVAELRDRASALAAQVERFRL